MFQSDGDENLRTSLCLLYFIRVEFIFENHASDTRQQNRVVERKHRHILKMVCIFLIDASIWQLIFGLMLLMQLSTPSIGFLLLVYIKRHPLKFYLKESLTTRSLNLLNAHVFQILWHLPK